MRKFRVGDRVRFELDGRFPGWPRWNYRTDGEPSGKWKEDTVRQVDDGRNHFCLSMLYYWPQPDHPFARYGAPGYLELVEAVEEQEDRDCTTCRYADGDYCSCIDTCEDSSQWESLKEYLSTPNPPTKTMTVDEAAEMVESILMVRAYNHVDFVAKERAQAIAEALIGKTVVKK